MATARLIPNSLIFTSDGTDVNARLDATNDAITFNGDSSTAPVSLNNAASVQLAGSTSGTLTHTVPTTVTSYTVTWPNAVGSANQVLSTDASGNLSWTDITAPTALTWKQSVVAATTAPGTLATDFEDGDTLDGVTLSTGDRILIKDQASGVENGIYIVQAAGAPVRADDLPAGASASGVAVVVNEGTTNADQGWLCTTDAPNDVVGTDALSFSLFSSINPVDVAGVSGDIQYNNGSDNLAAATLSSFNFTDNGATPSLAVGVEAGTFTLDAVNATTADTAGSALALESGVGNGTGAGGQISITSGAGGATANSGSIQLVTGVPTAGNDSGSIQVTTQDATTTGSGGAISVTSGNGGTDGAGGNITITSGNGGATSGDAGDVTITAGTAAGTGADGQIALVQNGNTFNWPVDTPAVGEVLKVQAFAANVADLEWAADTATPGGNDTEIQFNNAGSLGGTDNFVIPAGETSTTLRVLDSAQIAFGTGDDLAISHDGTNSSITNATGNLSITNNALTSDVIFTLGDSDATSQFLFDNSGGTLVAINGDGPNSTSTTTGTVVITGGLGVSQDVYANEFFATSDVQFKTNINRIDNPLEKLLSIEGYTYNWKGKEDGKKRIGVIAQQLEEVGLGDLVASGDTKAVNYTGLIPLIIEAIKELVDSIEFVDE